MRIRTSFAAAVAAVALLGAAVTASQAAAAAGPASRPCGTESRPGAYKHVIWIFMENQSYGTVIGSPNAKYINAVAGECGLATNYHSVTHPSLPNYIAATSGLPYASLHGFLPDCNPGGSCQTSAKSIFGQGETWRAYDESMPSACDRSNAGNYAARHNPAVYYTTLRGCAGSDVPYSRLAGDLAHNRLPGFSFITPNLIDDMHNGTVADGSTWLSRNLPVILASPEYRNGSTVVFITWDEGEGGHYAAGEHCAANTSDVSCHVATLVISPSTKPGTRSGTLFSHYSLLATAEQLLHLPSLGLAGGAATMTKAFSL
jgi:phospholipase C